MTADPWLPVGHKITDEIVVGALLFSGEGWQIYRTLLGDRVLVAEPVLIYKWTTSGLISEDLIRSASFGPHTIGFLACSKGYDLYPVQQGKSPDAKVDALAFSAALKESRKLIIEVSFHDAIYVEQYSRLLPTFTLSPPAEDERVLGMWVTGGVNVSTKSFRRLCQLTGWLTSSDLAEIVTAAGLASETGIALLSREKPNLGGVRNDDDAASNSSTAQDITVRHHGTEISYPSFLLPGRPQLEAFFNDYVIDIIQHPDKYDHLGITFPRQLYYSALQAVVRLTQSSV